MLNRKKLNEEKKELGRHKKIFMPMRLQPPHKCHIELICDACRIADEITILLFNSDIIDIRNPFTGDEREEMLKYSLDIEKISNYRIVKMPYFEDNKDRFDFVFDNNLIDDDTVVLSGDAFVINAFSEIGYKVLVPTDVMSSFCPDVSGSRLREMIAQGNEQWKEHAAIGTITFYEKFNMRERIKRVCGY